jgi:multimeric flavodoxin WrbA
MKKVAVVYHSGFGHTEIIAEHVSKGAAQVANIEVKLFKSENVTDTPDVLNEYDAIIFGSPTYMASISGPFKTFMDATSKIWFTRKWKNKIAAGFTNSHSMSGDKLNSLIAISLFASQHGMIWVSQSEMNGSPDGEPGKHDEVNRIGSHHGLMTQADNLEPEVTPPVGDKKSAELFGKRVAEITLAFNLRDS